MIKKTGLALLTLIPVILISLVIFGFSSEPGEKSDTRSRGVIYKLIDIFYDTSDMSEDEKFTLAEHLKHTVRKTAHFLEYAALGFFIYLHLLTWLKKMTPLFAGIASAVFAASDEIHQYFVPERAMKLYDVFVDILGASAGICVLILLILIIKKIRQKRQNRASD